MNAILNKNAEKLKGCTIYVALFPCNECAKLIIQSGIRKVLTLTLTSVPLLHLTTHRSNVGAGGLLL
jgi:deoxycytidylate deaminase